MTDADTLVMRAVAEIKFFCAHYGQNAMKEYLLFNMLGVDEETYGDLIFEMVYDGQIIRYCTRSYTIWSNSVYLPDDVIQAVKKPHEHCVSDTESSLASKLEWTQVGDAARGPEAAAILARLREMAYALDGGNLDRTHVEPDCIRDWIVYVDYGMEA